MMAKIVSLKEAVALVQPGHLLGISGFLGVGEPFELIEGLVEQGTIANF